MSILATIRNHSGRVYQGIQLLLLLSVGSAAFAAVADASLNTDIALTACMAAAGMASLTLIYMRRSVVHELKKAAVSEAERHHLMKTDALTGATTRRFFLEDLRGSLGGIRNKKKAALVLVDVDHFKQLNDSFGHQFGDNALAYVVEVAQRQFPDCLIGRLGGDEFAIIAPHDDLDMLNKQARSLLEILRAGISHEGNQIPLSASVGIAIAPLHASQANELMLCADLALYDSKAAGRGRATVFDREMLSDKRYRRQIERELRAAVYLNHLELNYQPITDVDGSTFALEGLVRWRHPVRGMIPPGDFISIAERSSLIDTVGEWVFKRACADMDHFPGRCISINVSGEQLKRDEVVLMTDRVLRQTGRTADQFVIEITETVATTATAEVLRRLEALRSMGFRIALDDFGTGHCGFNYLTTLPIDSIKIDRSYIRNLASDPIAQIFVAALARIARIRNFTIVAEGVETEEEFLLAKAAGCDRFQGYYICRPEPIERLGSLSFDLSDAPLLLSA